ncbi:LysM peptidoglycan-binding domain-containing protein, partial [candidate division GN15 bacterium]|nr:LysM peptidoglycan-binding domain-containing protein [candidate division GN15 bacterium]
MMKLKLLVLPVVLLAVLMSVASEVKAVSEAAVLYLRIAPGARAAGMGEAFVAIADDATATHWNPAGLGTYPLADSWRQASVPDHLRPVEGIAALKSRGGSDYQAYEVWAITAKGLARYDNESWNFGETFRTKSTQTVRQIVAQYFNTTDEERIADMAHRVAEANNKKSRDYLVNLADSAMAVIPEDHESYEPAQRQFDSLIAAYDQCRVDWEYVQEVEKLLGEAREDETITEVESDRISFAVEKARHRTIYEELVIPYGVALGGELTAITSTEDYLVVGTDKGLLVYNGKNWTAISAEAGLPGERVTTLERVGKSVLVGTDNGIALVTGTSLATLPGAATAPVGKVEAIGAKSIQDIWLVIDGQLHQFNGSVWSEGISYTVTIDDTIERLAAKFSIYDTEAEQEAYINRLYAMQSASEPDTAMSDTTMMDTTMADTLGVDEAEAESEPEIESTPTPLNLEPGTEIMVPFSAGIKGKVNAILVQDYDRLLIGTEYGMLRFTPTGWTLMGYSDYTVAEGETFDDIVNKRRLSGMQTAEHYQQALMAVNGLDQPEVSAGQSIKVYSAPLAAPIYEIQSRSGEIYAATAEGAIAYDGVVWQRADETGLGSTDTRDIAMSNDEFWLTTEDKLITKANGRNEISFMHVNWLPDLADDLYYEFLSFV